MLWHLQCVVSVGHSGGYRVGRLGMLHTRVSSLHCVQLLNTQELRPRSHSQPERLDPIFYGLYSVRGRWIVSALDLPAGLLSAGLLSVGEHTTLQNYIGLLSQGGECIIFWDSTNIYPLLFVDW